MKKPSKYTSNYWDYLDWEHEQMMAELDRKRAIDDSHPQEARKPLTVEEEIILRHRLDNQIHEDMTLEDVLYEDGAISTNDYFKYTNAYTDIKSKVVIIQK